MTYISGNKPHNKVSSESESFIKKNYKTMSNPKIGKSLGINSGSVLRIMNRLGVKRTKEEIMALIKGTPVVEPTVDRPIETPIEKITDVLIKERKVPIVVNENTTIWVKKSKCVKGKDGKWTKKTELNVLKAGKSFDVEEDVEHLTSYPPNYYNGVLLQK